MATPTLIPIKGDISTHSGPLGIVKVYQPRSTELDALRKPAHSRAGRYIFEPPTYWGPVYDKDGKVIKDGSGKVLMGTHYKVWCPSCSNKGEEPWQKREAFYPNKSRTNGLQGICKTCDNEKRAERRRRSRAA